MAQSMKNVQIINVNSGKALDVTDDGKSVTQRAADQAKKSQRWNITVVDERNHLYLIENVQNGKVLAPDGEWGEVFQAKGKTNQQWILTFLGENVYHIGNPYSNASHRLEVDGSSKNEGATVAQYAPHGGANQKWVMTATSTRTPGLPEYVQAGGSGWAWGYGAYGQLGANLVTDAQWTPVEVAFPRSATANVVTVAAGYLHSLAAFDDGSIWAWGHYGNGRLGIGAVAANQGTPAEVAVPRSVTGKAISVAAGGLHSLAAFDDGSIWAWGYYAWGRLGVGQVAADQWTPAEVALPRNISAKAIAVSAGVDHSLALLDDGSVWSWGENDNGRLGVGGQGAYDNAWTPAEVIFPRSLTGKAIAVAAGGLHSLAAFDDGSIWAWGHYGNGRLGIGAVAADQWTPAEVALPRNFSAKVIAIAGGMDYSLAAFDDGSVWAWGYFAWGRLGVGQVGADQWTPVQVAFPRRVTAKAIAVAAGYDHSLALLDDGSVWSWGENDNGRLGVGGQGAFDNAWAPAEVIFPRNVTAEVIAIDGGYAYSLICNGMLRH